MPANLPGFPEEPNTADIDSATGRIRRHTRAFRESVPERQENLVAWRLRLLAGTARGEHYGLLFHAPA